MATQHLSTYVFEFDTKYNYLISLWGFLAFMH